jgi:hypothetical protein
MENLHQKSLEEIIECLKDNGLLNSVGPVCPNCRVPTKWRAREAVIDRYGWRCTICSTFFSIRYNSFFEGFRMPLSSIIGIVNGWAFGHRQVDVATNVDSSRQSVISVFQRLRIIAVQSLDKDNLKLGGDGQIVEIDESLFARVKHHRGKDLLREQVWTFGMYERNRKVPIFQVVDSRDALSLLGPIYKYVAEKSLVYSDCWRAYRRISNLDKNYTHLTVNHDLNFVDPQSGVHTNGIESSWRAAKQPFKAANGVNRKYVQCYLDEISWRKLVTSPYSTNPRSDAYLAVFDAIRKFYKLGK